MKYELEIDIQPKALLVPVNMRVDEKTMRDFKHVAKLHGQSMTHIMTKLLREFVHEYQNKGMPKQKSFI
jgi:hypothetical protein